MAESKKPPRSGRTSRPSIRVPSPAPPRSSKAPGPKIIDPGDRLSELEDSLAKANVEIALLRQKTDALRADVEALRSLVVVAPLPGARKGPPPLPIEHRQSSPEIIMVDERDVTLESIRPKGR